MEYNFKLFCYSRTGSTVVLFFFKRLKVEFLISSALLSSFSLNFLISHEDAHVNVGDATCVPTNGF